MFQDMNDTHPSGGTNGDRNGIETIIRMRKVITMFGQPSQKATSGFGGL